jgi:hypothetical protein
VVWVVLRQEQVLKHLCGCGAAWADVPPQGVSAQQDLSGTSGGCFKGPLLTAARPKEGP